MRNGVSLDRAFPNGVWERGGGKMLIPATRRLVENGLNVFKVLRVFVRKNLGTAAHVCARQLVARMIVGAELELTLPQTEMEEWVADRLRAVHGREQRR